MKVGEQGHHSIGPHRRPLIPHSAHLSGVTTSPAGHDGHELPALASRFVVSDSLKGVFSSMAFQSESGIDVRRLGTPITVRRVAVWCQRHAFQCAASGCHAEQRQEEADQKTGLNPLSFHVPVGQYTERASLTRPHVKKGADEQESL